MPDVIISDQNHNTGMLRVAFERIGAEGIVYPLLTVTTQISTLREDVQVTPYHLSVKLLLGSEVIGQGSLRRCGKTYNHYPSQETFEIQTNLRALSFVNDSFRQPYLTFALQMDCFMQYADRKTNQNLTVKSADCGLSFMLSKIDWLSLVLEPIKFADFALLEVPIPAIPEREKWEKALKHIEEAEGQYRAGNDPEVLSRCYAAYEAIGRVEQYLASMANDDKRRCIIEIADSMRRVFNKGRHVDRTGGGQGEFPVDHRDSEFALHLVKSYVVYVAKVAQKTV